MLTETFLLPFFLALGLSSPIASREESSASPITFVIIAARSASPVQLQPVNANGNAFWVGKETTSYCPLTDQTRCPRGKSTIFAAGGGGASMNVVVPGGQQVYVASNGALRFTTAHSAYIPAGSAVQGFNATIGEVNGPLGRFNVSGLGATGFLACPTNANGAGPYQVFANVKGLKNTDVPGENQDKCLGFSALTAPVDREDLSAFVWQYT
ncbi:MAG: hypothetical protein LQ341_000561 [Variospora aurantia]|nr:MAG: hypothetical protein LQ341_000561 [Variospora aurantia]